MKFKNPTKFKKIKKIQKFTLTSHKNSIITLEKLI